MDKQISRIKLLWLMLVTTLMLGLSVSSALAQKFYPVHAQVQLLRPYGLHLTDYYSGSRDKFIITLNNRDNEQPFLQARLRIRIKNHGFQLSSREEVIYPMLELNSGIPLRLTSTDITPYLLPQNLNLNGRLNNGRLPTGMTEFSVQVVEYYSQRPLSAWHTARAWLDSKKPPMLKLPSKDEQIAFREPTNIRFQWLPRHQGLAQTEYEFVLKELPDNGAAPQSAFAYGIEIFRTRTRFTRLIYNQLMPMLEPNRRYAWQVQAIALDGIDEIGLFENNGFSEIGWFYLSEECPAPTGLKAVPKYARAELSWSAVPQATAYTLAYRPKSSQELFEWTELQVFDNKTTAYKLKKGWTYEWRVGTLGQSNKPVYSDLHEFTVLEEDTELLENCGKVPNKSVISQEPKLDLSVGDIVTIGGDYPMRVTELQNLGDGWYSGKGKTELTTLVRVQVALQFNRLRVNTDNKQCDGRVEAIYEKGKGHIENTDHWDDGGETLKTGSLSIVEHKLDIKLPPMPKMTLNEETGEVETEDPDGKIHVIKLEVPQNGIKSVFPMLITDKEGNTYEVSKVEPVSHENFSLKDKGQQLEVIRQIQGDIPPPKKFDKEDLARQDSIIKTLYKQIVSQTNFAPKLRSNPTYMRYVNGAKKYAKFFLNNIIFRHYRKSSDGWYEYQKINVFYDKGRSDGDIMSTIYHEYLHHINKILKIHPFLYRNKKRCNVLTRHVDNYIIASKEEILGDAYNLFFMNKKMKGLNYPYDKDSLNQQQLSEFKSFLKENPELLKRRYVAGQYFPSNFLLDELFVYRITLLQHKYIFNMSNRKRDIYHKQIKSYINRIKTTLDYEKRYSFEPTGTYNGSLPSIK